MIVCGIFHYLCFKCQVYFLFTAVANESKMAKENTPERPIPKPSSGTVTKSTSGTRIKSKIPKQILYLSNMFFVYSIIKNVYLRNWNT